MHCLPYNNWPQYGPNIITIERRKYHIPNANAMCVYGFFPPPPLLSVFDLANARIFCMVVFSVCAIHIWNGFPMVSWPREPQTKPEKNTHLPWYTSISSIHTSQRMPSSYHKLQYSLFGFVPNYLIKILRIYIEASTKCYQNWQTPIQIPIRENIERTQIESH